MQYTLPQTYLTLDPGSVGTGYAFWSLDSLYPTATGILATDAIFFQRMKSLFFAYNLIVGNLTPITVYCEEPHYFQTATGIKSARREDFTKLVSSYGGLWAISSVNGHTWVPISINEWKGQLPKAAMIQRIRRILPQANYSSHEADAVGLGLYLRGWK